MADPEIKIEIDTNWKINTAVLVRGFHHLKFGNKGVVLSYEREKNLSYSHLSSFSRLRTNQKIIQFLSLF